jgi:carbon storage regulator
MLVLCRKTGEEIVIGGAIRVRVVAVHANHVKLGFTAPAQVKILRDELCGPPAPPAEPPPAPAARGAIAVPVAPGRPPAAGAPRSSARSHPGGNATTAELSKLKDEVLASGRIGERQVVHICRTLFPDGEPDRDGVHFLAAVRREAVAVCPSFEELFADAVKYVALDGGFISAEATAWLREILDTGGRTGACERKILRDLRREARRVSSEFRQLYGESMRGPPATGG